MLGTSWSPIYFSRSLLSTYFASPVCHVSCPGIAKANCPRGTRTTSRRELCQRRPKKSRPCCGKRCTRGRASEGGFCVIPSGQGPSPNERRVLGKRREVKMNGPAAGPFIPRRPSSKRPHPESSPLLPLFPFEALSFKMGGSGTCRLWRWKDDYPCNARRTLALRCGLRCVGCGSSAAGRSAAVRIIAPSTTILARFRSFFVSLSSISLSFVG